MIAVRLTLSGMFHGPAILVAEVVLGALVYGAVLYAGRADRIRRVVQLLRPSKP